MATPIKPPSLGIDIGRVIISPVQGGKADTGFLHGDIASALSTPPGPGAFDGIRQLVMAFKGRVWLISKAGKNTEHKTRLWLRHHQFYALTHIPEERVVFCRYRKAKTRHCIELGISHFIDDRLDVLRYMRQSVNNLFLFGEQRNDHRHQALGWTIEVNNWPTTVTAVLATLPQGV